MEGNKFYKYILVDNMFYINIEQNVLTLFLNLFRRTKPFSFFMRKTGITAINYLPNSFIRLLRVLQFTFKFYQVKRDSKLFGSLQKVKTKHFGQILLELRQGEIKVFNLKNQLVTTEFRSQASNLSVKERVSALQRLSSLSPKLISWNIEEGYIVEEYINYHRPSYELNKMEKYYAEVFPILEEISNKDEIKLIDLDVYISDKISYLKSKIDIVSKVGVEIEEDTIKEFILNLDELLNKAQHLKGLFIKSHGDLWEGNILLKNKRSYVIDWDTLGFRSMYFDFFYSMFMMTSKNSHFEKVDKNKVGDLYQVLETSFQLLYQRIKNCNKYTNHSNDILPLKWSSIHRYLFYLELMYLKFQNVNVSMEKRVNEITTWIERFQLYEENRMFHLYKNED